MVYQQMHLSGPVQLDQPPSEQQFLYKSQSGKTRIIAPSDHLQINENQTI